MREGLAPSEKKDQGRHFGMDGYTSYLKTDIVVVVGNDVHKTIPILVLL